MGVETKAEMIQHEIRLTAKNDGDAVVIVGDGGMHLARDSGAHRFEFRLADETDPKVNVRFKRINQGMLDVKDDVQVCPPPAGKDTRQIIAETRSPDGLGAGFVDKNDNRNRDMPISYQFNFDCDDPTKLPICFDPIIINGGDEP
jgi:hypothetical protein